MLDSTDLRLLAHLQENAQSTAQELGDILFLSPSQAGRRRQRLEQEGYVTSVRARLDPVRLGLDVQAFVQVSMSVHSPVAARKFQALMKMQPEVISVWTLTGEADYLMQVFCRDLKALNSLVHDVFLPHEAVARVQTRIVMEQLKIDAPLPVREG